MHFIIFLVKNTKLIRQLSEMPLCWRPTSRILTFPGQILPQVEIRFMRITLAGCICEVLLKPCTNQTDYQLLSRRQWKPLVWRIFVLFQSQGAHTWVVDRYVWMKLFRTQACVISCRTSVRWSFRHIWQSFQPLPTRNPSSHAYIIRFVLYRRVRRGGEDCQVAEWPTIARPTRDDTSLGSNNLYPNISVHNSRRMGSLCSNFTFSRFSFECSKTGLASRRSKATHHWQLRAESSRERTGIDVLFICEGR